jgi:hypothetical protein
VVRARLGYAVAVAVTIGAGLGSRACAAALPWWLAKNLGDALYATMVFWGLRVIAPGARTAGVALGATGWCFAVEASQLYRAGWLDAVRATTPGRLVLGQGFHAFDLVCYALGVGLAVGLERAVRGWLTDARRDVG